MKEVHPGDLREQIDIVHETSVLNENGYPAPLREIVCAGLWAAVEGGGDQMTRAGDAQLATDTTRFVIRQRSGIDVGMLVIYEGEAREIVGIEHVGVQREYLSLKTKARKAVGG